MWPAGPYTLLEAADGIWSDARNSILLWNPEDSLPSLQDLIAGSYPEPFESSLYPHILFSEGQF